MSCGGRSPLWPGSVMKMSEYHRQHPLMILQMMIRGLIQMVWILIVVLFSLSNAEQDFITIYIMVAVLVLTFVWAVLSWLFFTYRFEDDTLHIRSGIIFKQERSIRKQRVQSVNVFTNILQQPFQVSRLQVKTAGSGTEVEFNLHSVKWKEAERIRDALRGSTMAQEGRGEASEPIRFHSVNRREMFIAGLTSGRFLVLFSLIFAIYFQFAQFIPPEYVDQMLEQLEATPIHLLLLLSALILLASWLISTLYFVIQYYNFNIWRGEDTLHLSWGIIEEKKVTVRVERVQALTVKESPLRQMVGRCSLHMELTGGGEKNTEQIKLLCPILARRDVDQFLLDILPEYSLPEIMAPLPSRSRRRYLFRAVIPVLIIALPLHYLQVPFFFLAYLPLVLAVPLAILRHREAATALSGSHLCLRFRYFSLVNAMVKKNHLQSLTLSANPFQRISSLRNVSTAVLSSPAGVRFTVKDVDMTEAAGIWSWYSRDAGQ